ncbi:MAG: hypothetical protein MUF64_21965 [Polyangiaceae bacterium]|jgi:hypothetical protein|nr:hypothetical protein [Polyangiaceae bacterium]
MRLLELALLYALIGVGACALSARRGRGGAGDLALMLLLWPMLAPVLLTAPGGPPQAGEAPELAGLLEALRSVQGTRVAPLLPAPDRLAPLGSRLRALELRAGELEAVLRQRQVSGEDPEEAASHGRLAAMLEETRREREGLVALCRRLRAQILVVRFSGADEGDVRELAAELLGRVEGARAAVDPGA